MLPPAPTKKKKKKKKHPTPADTHTTIPMSDEQQIDYNISGMLGAWQVGDTDRLHQAYADDAVFVSAVWAPPVFGWSNYLPLYQHHPTPTQQLRLHPIQPFIKLT